MRIFISFTSFIWFFSFGSFFIRHLWHKMREINTFISIPDNNNNNNTLLAYLSHTYTHTYALLYIEIHTISICWYIPIFPVYLTNLMTARVQITLFCWVILVVIVLFFFFFCFAVCLLFVVFFLIPFHSLLNLLSLKCIITVSSHCFGLSFLNHFHCFAFFPCIFFLIFFFRFHSFGSDRSFYCLSKTFF